MFFSETIEEVVESTKNTSLKVSNLEFKKKNRKKKYLHLNQCINQVINELKNYRYLKEHL